MQNRYFMILCGGGGHRLWPLSRKNRPKQFIPFLNDKSLLQHTIDRIIPLANSKENIGVVTIKNQADYIKQNFKDNIGMIIQEPASCNTGPAILYSCLQLQEKNKDAVVLYLAADTFVPDSKAYRSYLNKAIEYAANNDKIVTLGVMPTRPATGYGYIQADSKEINCGQFYNVGEFHEKPKLELAKQYIQQSNMFWNIGIFACKVSVFIEEFKVCAPDVFDLMQQYLEDKIEYKDITNISVDYAVMEKSDKVVLLPCDFEWYDIGNLDVFLSLQKRFFGDSIKIININSSRNLAQVLSKDSKKKIVAFIGVDDLCLVEDEDVILVAKRDEVESVKEVLVTIKKESLQNFL